MIAWRICRVRSRSALLLPCWSAVFAVVARSRLLTFVLSGGVSDDVCAWGNAVPTMSPIARAIPARVSRQFTLPLLVLGDMDERVHSLRWETPARRRREQDWL